MGEIRRHATNTGLIWEEKLNFDLRGYLNRGPDQLTMQGSGYASRANEG